MSHKTRPSPLFIFWSGMFILIASVVLGWIVLPNLIYEQIRNNLKLRSGSEVWDKWINPPVPVYFKVYLFNVTNPSEITQGYLPKLQEVGPFVYRELREKINIQEHFDKGVVKYKEKITYLFDSEKSNGLVEDLELTILNIPYVAMAQKVSELPYPLDSVGISYIVKFKEKPFIKKKVREILFQGWYVQMVAELQMFDKELMPNNTFGLFYGKNGTDDGYLEVDSGIQNADNFGNIKSWKDHRELPWWREGTHCNHILGTDGSIFPPFVRKDRIIRIFNAELCRSLYLTFNQEIEFLGIPGYRFTAPQAMLEDPRTSEDNRCYCLEEEIDQCPRAGMIDLSVCREGAPVAMSTPYFLDGFKGYQNDSGLNPNRNLHETVLDLEPNTGIVLHAHKRIQMNVIMKPVASIRSLSKMPEMVFPIVWADETAEIDEEIAQVLKYQLIVPLIALEITRWALVGVSLLLILSALVRCYFHPNPDADEQVDKPLRNKDANGNSHNIRSQSQLSRLQSKDNPKTPFLT